MDLIMGPTRNHILRYHQPPRDHQIWSDGWWFALCGYRTYDKDRLNNHDWAHAPMCKRCADSPEGKLALEAATSSA